MKNFLSIAAFALLLSLLYTAVGNVLPQYPSYPPPILELGSSMPVDEVVAAGSSVFEANCSQCHKIGGASRCPDLADMGRKAHERAVERQKDKGAAFDDADYLLESVCRPGDYLTAGFGNIMPPQGRALEPGQIVAVAMFLQDQGGEVTLSLADVEKAREKLAKSGCGTGDAAAAPAVAAAPVGTPEEVWTAFGCGGCHSRDTPTKLVGPSLQDVGKRLDKGAIFEAILVPDATLAEGFPPGLMTPTLAGNGFYERMKPADYTALVDWLADHRGP